MFRRTILKILGGSVVLPALFSTAVTAGYMPAPFDNPGDVKKVPEAQCFLLIFLVLIF